MKPNQRRMAQAPKTGHIIFNQYRIHPPPLAARSSFHMQAPTLHPDTPLPWGWGRLLLAPHRVAFAGAQLVLILSSLWWLYIQLARAGWLPPTWQGTLAFSPTLAHGTAMTFGFAPLFFCGFLFTAGPKWLQVEPPQPKEVLSGIVLQGLGWTLWLVGAQTAVFLALLGGGLAWLGLCLHVWAFVRLLHASHVADKLHARLIALASCVGLVALGGVLVAVALEHPTMGRTWNQTGLWAYVALVYVTVAHRMIPFFTASALPMVTAWRPLWVLFFLCLAIAHKVLTLWLDAWGLDWPVWRVASSFWLLVTGLVLLWLAFVWGLVQSLSVRLLAMLHIGFLWLSLGFLLDATGHFWTLVTGEASWTLGALHATTMGFMGSLLLAMVTRVSCGHGGRALIADRLVWTLFLTLQVATLVRVAAAVLGSTYYSALTVLAALLWAVAVVPWAIRLICWYGQPRPDGRPG